jgi:transcriptional regulator with XRE-family HTH domain
VLRLTESDKHVNRIRFGPLGKMPYMGKSKRMQDVARRLWTNIEALLAHHRITRYQLGQQTGINNGGVQRLECGDNVGYQLIEKVAERYGYTAGDLLSPDFNPAMHHRKPDEHLQKLLGAYPYLTSRQRKRIADMAIDIREENDEVKQSPR